MNAFNARSLTLCVFCLYTWCKCRAHSRQSDASGKTLVDLFTTFQGITSDNCWFLVFTMQSTEYAEVFDLYVQPSKRPKIHCNFWHFSRLMVSDRQIKKIIIIVLTEKKPTSENSYFQSTWDSNCAVVFERVFENTLTNIIYHASCGKDYQRNQWILQPNWVKFGEFASIWLSFSSNFVLHLHWSANSWTVHVQFIEQRLIFAFRYRCVCCWKSSYMHSIVTIIFLFSKKSLTGCMQAAPFVFDRYDQQQQQRHQRSLLIGFSFCSRSLCVIYHRNYAVTLTEVF